MISISSPNNEEDYLTDSTLTASSSSVDLFNKRPLSASALTNNEKRSKTSLSRFLEKKSLFRKRQWTELVKKSRSPRRNFKQSKFSSRIRGGGDKIEQRKTEDKANLHSKAEDNPVDPSEPQVFPFKSTPSGNYKLKPSQIVYESKNLSIVAADPANVSLNITESESLKPDQDNKTFFDNWPTTCLYTTVGKENVAFSEFDTTSESDREKNHTSELSLAKMGYMTDNCIEWNKFTLPKKTDLKKVLLNQVLNMINPDIQVKIGTSVYKCHRIVLQCYSSFFVSKTATQVELSESSVPSDVFSLIYQWMLHMGTDSYRLLKRNNILHIFRAAQYLGIRELEDQCWAFVDNGEIFSEDKAFLLYLEARKINNKVVMELMVPRIQRFFLTLVSSKEFIELNSDEVCTFLESNYICIHCEEEVFMAGVRWLKHDWAQRKTHTSKIMACIRFGLMNCQLLLALRRGMSSPEFKPIMSIPEVSKMVEDGLSLQTVRLCLMNEPDENLENTKKYLNLVDPLPRNWAGTDRCYQSYTDFLKDLSHYRSKQRLEIKKSKMKMQLQRVDDDDFLSSAVLLPETQQKFKRLNRDQTSLTDCLHQLEPRELNKMREMTGHDDIAEDTRKKMKEKLISMPSEEYVTYGTTGAKKQSSYKKQQYNDSMRKKLGNQRNNQIYNSPSLEEQEIAAKKIQMAYRNYSAGKLSRAKSSFDLMQDKAARKIQKAYRNHSSKKLGNRAHDSKVDRSKAWRSRSDPSLLSDPTRSSTHPRNKCEDDLLPLRVEKETVFMFGGSNPYVDNDEDGYSIYYYHTDCNEWRKCGEMPEPRHYHSITIFQGKIYVAGGKHPSRILGEPGTLSSKVWRYDSQSMSWSRIRDMLIARRSFGLVPCNNKLYVVGGRNEQDRAISNVEKFDSFSNGWVTVAPMQQARAGAAINEFKGQIWVAGGLIKDNNMATNSVEYYNCQRNIWTNVPNLRFTLAYAVMVPVNNKIYLVGGALGLRDNNLYGSGKQIDVWDPESQTWGCAGQMSKPRHAHTAVYLRGAGSDDGYMFIMGGMSTRHCCVTDNVECWRVKDGQWIMGVAPLPSPVSGAAALVLPCKTFG